VKELVGFVLVYCTFPLPSTMICILYYILPIRMVIGDAPSFLVDMLYSILPENAVQLADSDRVIEAPFSPEFLSAVDPDYADFLRNLAFRDSENDPYTPQLNNSTKMSEKTPYGELELGDVVRVSNESVLYSIRNRPDLTINYQANCDPANGYVHPLVDQYWLSSHTGISDGSESQRIHFVSPPALLPIFRPWKLERFTMTNRQWYDCMGRNGVVRYAILEIARASEHATAGRPDQGGALSLQRALILSTRKVVDAIWNMNRDLFPGMVYPGNFLVAV
jgi:hypothetical protein